MNDSVILYSTHCPKCMVLKKKLGGKGVIYTENTSVEEMLSLGINEVPVLRVNDELMDFSAAIAWLNKQ